MKHPRSASRYPLKGGDTSRLAKPAQLVSSDPTASRVA